MKYKEIIDELKCIDIPDTRRLQEIRLSSINRNFPDEKFMKKHYASDYATPRILLMPREEIKQVYSLSIPLTFPLGDPIGYWNGCETFYFRWASGDCQKGAVHLTTSKNLDKLKELFSKNNISMQQEEIFGNILDLDILNKTIRNGITVPHSWKIDGYDPSQSLFRHQFVEFNELLFASPYYSLEKEISHKKEEKGYKNSSISLTEETKEIQKISCRATFYTPNGPSPESYLPRLIKNYENNLKERHSDWISSHKDSKETFHSLELKLLHIAPKIEIYKPSWIE